MDFSISAKELSYTNRVKEFINQKIKPDISGWYEEGRFPLSLFQDLYDENLMGFHEMNNRWEADPMSQTVILYEKIAELSPGLAVAIMSHTQLGLYPLSRWGNVWQKQEFIDPGVKGERLISFANTEPYGGSDVANIKLIADKVDEGYVLNGEKKYIINGCEADVFLVSAVTNPVALEKKSGITLFIIDENTKGIEIRELGKNVWMPANIAHLTFENVFIPQENILGHPNKGFHIMMKVFNTARIALSALTLGTAMGAYKLALSHCCKREVFDIPVIEHQSKSFEFAEKLTKLEATRLLVKKAAWTKDSGQKYNLVAAMANYRAMETAKEIAQWTAECFGASSVLIDNPVNRYRMDVLGSSLMAGTGDIHKLIISRYMHTWDNWDY